MSNIQCPHCQKPLTIPNRAMYNMETYLSHITIAAECCGRGVRLVPSKIINIHASKYTGTQTTDSWGTPLKID